MSSNLFTRQLTAEDVTMIAPLWGDRDALSAQELARALEVTRLLLATNRARGKLVVDDQGRLHGFGIAAFAHEAFAASYLARPYPQIGRCILLSESPHCVVLDESEVARRNAGDGLHLVVVSQGYWLQDGKWLHLLGTLIDAFASVHHGYRLASP